MVTFRGFYERGVAFMAFPWLQVCKFHVIIACATVYIQSDHKVQLTSSPPHESQHDAQTCTFPSQCPPPPPHPKFEVVLDGFCCLTQSIYPFYTPWLSMSYGLMAFLFISVAGHPQPPLPPFPPPFSFITYNHISLTLFFIPPIFLLLCT